MCWWCVDYTGGTLSTTKTTTIVFFYQIIITCLNRYFTRVPVWYIDLNAWNSASGEIPAAWVDSMVFSFGSLCFHDIHL